MSKMYDELAIWWPLISPLEEYADEAAFFRDLILAEQPSTPRTLLELGSGGGSNAFYLKSLFAAVTLTDLSPAMLAVGAALNPDCEHLPGDMRTLRLDRTFDVVFTHDAIDYMITPDDLRQAIATAFIHCAPGGVALFVPDHLRETYSDDSECGEHDADDRAIRWLSWTYDPDPADSSIITDYVFMLRDGDQPAHVEHDRHITGLHSEADWLREVAAAGFSVRTVTDAYDRHIFIARKP